MRLTRNIYPGLICGVVIMILTGLPGSCFPAVKTFWQWLGPDKIVHLFMFGGLAFLIAFGYRDDYCQGTKSFGKKLLALSFVISTAYGALTELLQKYVFIGRCGSRFDFYADVIGCILGVFIFKATYRKKIKKNGL